MSEPQAYLNGHYVAASQAVVSVVDAGFVQGTTVAEQLRTFGGRLFQLEAHIERLLRSLSIVGVETPHAAADFARIANKLVIKNQPSLAKGDDLGLAMIVTPGTYLPMVPQAPAGPTVCLHTSPLRFDLWAAKYAQGESLATTDVRQVPANCWPPELKCRSRMHYYLADRQARARFPNSRALMVDQEGFVTESTTANLVIYDPAAGLLIPPREKILPGISLAVLVELAARLGVGCSQRDLTPDDVAAAQEVFLTSTSVCAVAVVQLNGKPIGEGAPGPLYRQLIQAWSDLVGVDIPRQAEQFARR